MTEGDIYPELYFTQSHTSYCMVVQQPDQFAMIDNEGTIQICDLNDTSNISQKNVYTLPFSCDQYYSSDKQPYIYGYALREFEIINLQSGEINSFLPTYNGNSKICQIDIFSQAPFLLHIDMVKFGWKEDVHTGYIYNPIEDTLIDTIENFQGELFLLPDNQKIIELFGDPPAHNKWSLSGDLKDFSKTNKLTEKLSTLGMRTWAISFNPNNHLMLGHTLINDTLTNYSIKWDSTFDNIKIEPITYQFPEDRIFSERFQFSSDGKWMRTVSSDTVDLDADYITFFKIDQKYPQSISLPVYGTRSQIKSRGCFVETKTMGTVYIDVSEHYPGHLLVYKMSDVQNKIIEKMQKMMK